MTARAATWQQHLADRVQHLERELVKMRHSRDRQRARAELWRHRAMTKARRAA